MVVWHHWLSGHEFEQTPGDSEGQGSLVCCSPWGCKELDTTEWLNNNKCFSWNWRAFVWGSKLWGSFMFQHTLGEKKKKENGFLSWKKTGKSERERQEKIKTKMETCHRDTSWGNPNSIEFSGKNNTFEPPPHKHTHTYTTTTKKKKKTDSRITMLMMLETVLILWLGTNCPFSVGGWTWEV